MEEPTFGPESLTAWQISGLRPHEKADYEEKLSPEAKAEYFKIVEERKKAILERHAQRWKNIEQKDRKITSHINPYLV